MPKCSLLIVFLFSTIALQAQNPAGIIGRIYKHGSMDKDLMYVVEEFTSEFNDVKQIYHRYYNDEDVAIYEKVTIKEGSIINFETEIKELDFNGSVSKYNETITITRDRGGRIKNRTMDWKEDILVSAMFPGFVKENRDALFSGEIVEFLIPNFDFMTLIPIVLQIQKGEDHPNEGEKIIEMKPKSLFLRLFIEPVELVVDARSAEVLEIHGPTTLPEPGKADPYDLIKADIYFVQAN